MKTSFSLLKPSSTPWAIRHFALWNTLPNHLRAPQTTDSIKKGGHYVKKQRGKGECVPCIDGFYQPEETTSQMCKPCTVCSENSYVKNECTKETDTICRCHEGFVPWDGASDSSVCNCEVGFGIKDGGCSKCEYGYFNDQLNSHCKKWKECESGVKSNGTTTSDAICNDIITNLDVNRAYTTLLPSHRPQDKIETQNKHTTTIATTTTTTKATKAHSRITTAPGPPSNSSNHVVMALLVFGIFGLIALTVVTCKMHFTPCEGNRGVKPNDSLCRRPVEESGGSLSSLKLNPEEP